MGSGWVLFEIHCVQHSDEESNANGCVSACSRRADVNTARLMCWEPDRSTDCFGGWQGQSGEHQKTELRYVLCQLLEFKQCEARKHLPLKNHLLGMVMHTFNPRQAGRQADLCEFQASLVYIHKESSSTASNTQKNPILKKQKYTNKKPYTVLILHNGLKTTY